MTLFPRSPFQGIRRVIDVSGDGANNRGRFAEDARDEAVRAGVVINGLPILTLEPELDVYYRDSVIGGPGAFVIAVRSYEEFARAIRSKLVTEIATGESDFIPDSDHSLLEPRHPSAPISALPLVGRLAEEYPRR